MKNRCQLCGGKLENNRCVLCGLDNSKNDSRYITGETHHKNSPLTHVHKDNESPLRGKTMTREQRSAYNEAHRKWSMDGRTKNTFESVGRRKQPKRKKSGRARLASIVGIIVIVMIIFNMFSMLANIGGGFFTNLQEEMPDPYQYTVYEIPEEGETYSVELTAGIYVGGYNLPEGNYHVESYNDSGILELKDNINSIYITTDLYDDIYVEDLRIYNNSVLRINDGMKVTLATENAQPLISEGYANINTESFELNGEYEVGRDFPAGVYDLSVIEGDGQLSYESKFFDSVMQNYIWMGEYEEESKYLNVVLQNGMSVYTDDMTIRIEPSQIIYSEDYDEFYNR